MQTSKKCAFQVSFLLLCASFFQGCVPLATGVITYEAGVSHGERVAYTDYLFAMQAKNNASQKAGQSVQPILSETRWLKEIHQPHLKYAEYYTWSIEHGVSTDSLVPFEGWNEEERKKFQMAKRIELEKTNPTGKKGGDIRRN